jgi:hypothetical protein
MDKAQLGKPGDSLLDSYLVEQDEASREAVLAKWKRLIRALLKVATRIAHEERLAADSPEQPRRRRIPSLP